MNTICIMCPLGCALKIEKNGEEIVVKGNTCKRGERYGIDEFTAPKRAITTLVNLKSGGVASVKTTDSVPKERIFDVIKFIGTLVADDGVQIGDVIANDVLGLGVDVAVTGRK
ncbi:MAG: DUF1667 domain-containing protein [Bacteroides sp.]|nr:DUF1667 domain-containing protein [Bacillota bacterium]MCM1394249.1 DUF1667 domain-containing protein [[Eubacterium] siraeum]MCM1455710.1 DUF1667 domain-containing protein [Bacteroides sp.]